MRLYERAIAANTAAGDARGRRILATMERYYGNMRKVSDAAERKGQRRVWISQREYMGLANG